MGIYLTIDQGNSSAKIAVWEDDRLIEEEISRELTRQQLAKIAARFQTAKALCCSVTGNGKRMAQWLASQGVDASEVTCDMPLPLTIGYSTPTTLGEDRIAAAVGAWSLFPGEPMLVVDMGTAITYDVITAEGRFEGGNIAPGIGMRLRSLHSFTARLPEINGYGETPEFGHNTATAMRSGAVRGVVAEIEYYLSLLPAGTRVVLTGGWANHVSEFLRFPVTIDRNLVTKGLISILLYNENK